MLEASAALESAGEWETPAVLPAGASRDPRKRALDIFIATLGLLFVLPLLLIAALAIRIESDGPILFRQQRTGLGGKPFTILKLRTMRVLEDGPGLQHATRDDPRVTKVGAFLRKWSVDELPQLANVLMGHMSLVGPRPHALAHDALYSAHVPGYNDRFRVRPGLTGLAQVSGHRGEIHTIDCMDRRVAADRDYVDRWSIWLDATILVRTFPLVAQAVNAY